MLPQLAALRLLICRTCGQSAWRRSLNQLDFGRLVQINQELVDAFRPVLAIAEHMTGVAKAVEHFDRRVDELVPDAITGRTRVDVPLWADPGAIRELMGSSRREDLDRFFVRAYGAEGGQLSREVFGELLASTQLRRWQSLLRQAVSSYKRRQFLLVVPVLLLVFEGALAQAAGRLAKSHRPKDDARANRTSARPAIGRLVGASLESFCSYVFESRDFGGPAGPNQSTLGNARATRQAVLLRPNTRASTTSFRGEHAVLVEEGGLARGTFDVEAQHRA